MATEYELKLIPERSVQVKLIEQIKRRQEESFVARLKAMLVLGEFRMTDSGTASIVDKYFDTIDQQLLRTSRLVRLRKRDGQFTITLKIGKGRKHGLFDRDEFEFAVASESEALLDPAVRSALRETMDDVAVGDLRYSLTVSNTRRLYVAVRDLISLAVSVDLVKFSSPDGERVSEESIEVEVEANDDPSRQYLTAKREAMITAFGGELAAATNSKYERGSSLVGTAPVALDLTDEVARRHRMNLLSHREKPSAAREHVISASPILRLVLVLCAALGAILFVGGIYLALSGKLAETTFRLLGNDFSSKSIGVSMAFIGVIMVIVLFRRVLSLIADLARLPRDR